MVERAVDQAKLFGFEMAKVRPIDRFIKEGETIKFGVTEIEVIHVPGHAPGPCGFFISQNTIPWLQGISFFMAALAGLICLGGNYENIDSRNKKINCWCYLVKQLFFVAMALKTTIGFEKEK